MAEGRLKTRGSGNASAKLNEQVVRATKIALSLGVRQFILARCLGISSTQIWRIAHNVDWKHVTTD